MYSQYITGIFSPLKALHQQRTDDTHISSACKSNTANHNTILGDLSGGISQLLRGLGKQFSSAQFDTGDILLVLIILFLFLEGDNLELVITLGLMLLLGLNDN